MALITPFKNTSVLILDDMAEARTSLRALVGSLGCFREEAQFKRHIARIVAVMIDVNFEHRGIARQLLEACIAHAQEIEGLELLELGVTASSERAVRLYERAGFQPFGRMPRAVVIDGVGHDHLLMVLPLPRCPPLNVSD